MRAALIALGLVFAFLPQAARADDFEACTQRGYLYHFDPRLAAQECDLIATIDIHWRGRTAHMRAVHPRSMVMGDSAQFISRLQEVADRIGPAMDQMGGSLNLDDVTVLFTDLASPRDGRDEGFDRPGYIAAASSVFAAECPISYYKGDRETMDPNDFVFTLAHEIFHCIQFRSWPSMLDEDWLSEGTAEYFAYLAKPDYGPGFIPRFDARIQTTPLNRLDYSAVAFYLWMGDAQGPSRVAEFIADTRSFERAIDSDMWIEFAQRYYDQTIRLPGGGAIPSSPRMGPTRAIHGDDHLEAPEMVPYTLHNAVFVFDPDKVYTLTHTPNPPDVRVLWKRSDIWVAPLTSITTCDGEQRIRVIWASTRSTTGGSTDIHAEPAAASTCTCPAGVWHETSASLRRMMEQSATGGPGSIEFIRGARILQLNPDHTGSFTYEGVVTETLPRDDFWLRQTKTGGSHFTWSIRSGRLLTVLVPGDNLLNLYNELHTQQGVQVENRRAGTQSIGHDFSCDEAGLHLRQIAPSALGARFTVDMDFVRAGGGSGH